MSVGFTGTREGMTPAQEAAVRAWLTEHPGVLHHGDCVGADAQVHAIALELGLMVVLHPSNLPGKRAFCAGAAVVREPAPPLVRNRVIVEETDGLLTTPAGLEVRRSGTWSTVRYARRLVRPIVVVYPSGLVVLEGPHEDHGRWC